MKKSELTFTFLLVPLDYLMLLAAAASAYFIRFSDISRDVRPVIFNLPFDTYLRIAAVVAVAWIVIFAFAGLYRFTASGKIMDEFYRVILGCSTGLVTIIIFMFFQRELFSSRFIILAAWGLAIVYIMAARIIIRAIQRNLYAKGIGIHKIVIVGDTPATERVVTYFSSSHHLGFRIAKRIKEVNARTLEELAELAKQRAIDEIIQVDPNLSKSEVLQLLSICDEHHITFKYAADLLGTKILKTDVRMLGGLPIVEVKTTSLDGWGRINKRIFDIIFSAVILIIISPILLFLTIIIKLESRGPALYKNERVTKDGYFNVLKFRSMYIQYCTGTEYDQDGVALKYEQELIKKQNTKEEGGPVYKVGNDPRVTKAGKFLRRWSLDELPQFLNVLRGSMSIVGPRPHQPREVEKYQKHHKKVLAIKPGITGLAQISGRSDLSFEDEVKLDTYYIENWSLLRDIAIILRTPLALARGRRAE